MCDDLDRLDKLQDAATRKKEQKREKHRRRRETIRYIISLIWDAIKLVLFRLLLVSPIIALFLGGVAGFVLFIVLSWIVLTIIKDVLNGKDKIEIKDFFTSGTIIFNFVAYVFSHGDRYLGHAG